MYKNPKKIGRIDMGWNYKKKPKRFPKYFYNEVEAEVGVKIYVKKIGFTKKPTNNKNAIKIKHLK